MTFTGTLTLWHPDPYRHLQTSIKAFEFVKQTKKTVNAFSLLAYDLTVILRGVRWPKTSIKIQRKSEKAPEKLE